ncbi:MAG TPA: LysM peptidoglycan-binding domain-containing protein [Jatrophihabitans sp.]|nr:LysM peptidoglycan-binding domain-containing protein [Jatrophihabitans sp.]
MAVEKAYFEIQKPSKRAGQRVPCMFNPESISVSKSNSWGTDTASGHGIEPAKFQHAEAASMDLEVWFDTTDTGKSVTEYTGKIMGLLDIDEEASGSDGTTNNAAPPVVKFHWGTNFASFPAVVEEASLEFTYFSAEGVPLRAKVSLELTQYKADKAFGPQNPTSGTPYPHRTHRVMPGETLDRVSARYYGDSTRWRALASANGIEDPLTVRPGSLIVIPEITSL